MQYLIRSRSLVLLFCFLLLVLLGFVDYITTPEIALFYLFPISLASWLAGRGAGALMSTAGAAIWLFDDIYKPPVYENPYVPYWDATVRFGLFSSFHLPSRG